MIKSMVMLKAKPGMSREAFREYYETVHAPLALRLYPYFADYRRNYVDAEAYKARNGVDPDFDVLTEITFASREDYEKFRAAQREPENARAQREDEEKFLDRRVMRGFTVEETRSEIPAR